MASRARGEITLRHIEALRAVMQTGSATRAAERLSLSQPAISRILSDLEQSLGVKLFLRMGSRLQPTQEAQALYPQLNEIHNSVEVLRAGAARLRDRGDGDLKIACLPVATSLVAQAAASMLRERPGLRLSVRPTGSADIRQLVQSGEVSIGLVSGETATTGLEHETFSHFRAVCVMQPGHRLSGLRRVGPNDLGRERFITVSPEDSSRTAIDGVFEKKGYTPNIVAEGYTAAACCEMVAQGMGVAIVNPLALKGEMGRNLVARPFFPQIILTIRLLFAEHHRQSALSRMFVKMLDDAESKYRTQYQEIASLHSSSL